jgi:hypothetical protein
VVLGEQQHAPHQVRRRHPRRALNQSARGETTAQDTHTHTHAPKKEGWSTKEKEEEDDEDEDEDEEERTRRKRGERGVAMV